MASEFQVEVLLSSLKELQQEKLHNEKVLGEMCARRKQIEAKLETASAKHASAKHRCTRLAEAKKVEEQKVAKMRVQVKLLREVKEEKQQRIATLNARIAAADEQRQEQLTTFEMKMTSLAEKFRTAKDHYSDQSLEAKIALYDREKMELNAKAATSRARLDSLQSEVKDMESRRQSSISEDAIPTDTWRAVCDMFTAENEASKSILLKSVDKLQTTENAFSRLSKDLDELELLVHSTGKTHEE